MKKWIARIWNVVFRKPMYIFLNRVSDFCLSKATDISSSDGPGLEYQAPTKAEKEAKNRHAGIIVTLSITILIILLLVKYFSEFYYTVVSQGMSFGEWNGSAGSFWGAILGAFVAGIVTIIANYMVIHRSYRIDYHRERLEVLPIFSVEPVSINRTFSQVEEDIQQGASPVPPAVLTVFWGETSPEDLVNVCLLKNVGRGIAYNFYVTDPWPSYCDNPFGSMISPEKGVWIALPTEEGGTIKENSEFTAIYTDLYGNKYQQKFSIEINSLNMVQFMTSPPELIYKTKRIRYVQ